MIDFFKKIYPKYKEQINYMIFGTLTAVVNLAVKYLLWITVLDPNNGFQLQASVVISWIAAVVFAYVTNRKFVFYSTNKNIIKEFIGFVSGRLTTLLIEMFVMWFFVTYLKLSVIIFTFVAQVLVIVGNYIFSKLFVFKKTDK